MFMEPEVVIALNNLLSKQNAHYRYGVDLGCGYGEYGFFLKRYVDYLIGVDKNPARLSVAAVNGYDAVFEANILDFYIPDECDVVFLFDVIEHLPKDAGYELIRRIGSKTIYLTTPMKYFQVATNEHVSLWTVEELRSLGFEVNIIEIKGLRKMFYGNKILAYKIFKYLSDFDC